MSQTLATPRLHERAVRMADGPDVLGAIAEPDCAAAIWSRQPMPGFQDWIDGLDPAQLPVIRTVLRPDHVHGVVQGLCDANGLPDTAERYWLEADIADLAMRFSNVMQAPYLRLRLDRITTNACSKFHIDALSARLLCTYRGNGTQYGFCADTPIPEHIHQLATGSPMVMRGTLWPEQPRCGLRHRSPPIAGTGVTRLVMVLDPLSELMDD